jgi:hypothetical protein
MTHDPSEYIKGLQQLLISDKKNIAFLFGAGTSVARKSKDSIYVPAIEEMTQNIESTLNATELYKKALSEILDEIELIKHSYNIRDVEALLYILMDRVSY